MNFKRKIIGSIFFAACFVGLETASAAIVNLTDNGNGVNLGHSFTETNTDGVKIKVSAFRFAGNQPNPSSAGAQQSFIEAFGNFGLGIGGGNNPEHTADNRDNFEFFVIEFDQLVTLNSASITEWGNRSGRTIGGDSDIDYWGGKGAFSFDNLGPRFGDDVNQSLLGNGSRRNFNFSNGLGSVNWLLLGPEANTNNRVHDFIKLRKIDYTVAPVPLPATVWLMGSALLGLAGIKRKHGNTDSI